MKAINTMLTLSVLATLSGCGNIGSFAKSSGEYGILAEANKVVGVSWRCGNNAGTTDSSGKFGPCRQGDIIDFYIGSAELGTVAMPPDRIVTPQDIAGTSRSNAENPQAIKVATTLLSLDADGIPENGIVLKHEAVNRFLKKVGKKKSIKDLDEKELTEAMSETSAQLPGLSLRVPDKGEVLRVLKETHAKIESGEIKAPEKSHEDLSTN